jgi:hypothetical protein
MKNFVHPLLGPFMANNTDLTTEAVEGEMEHLEPRFPDLAFLHRLTEILELLRHESNLALLRETYLLEQPLPAQDIAETAQEMAISSKTLATLLDELVRLFELE